MINLDAFTEWKQDSCAFVLHRLDRKAYQTLQLETVVDELADLYATYLLEHHIVDAQGDPTGTEPDEDELLESLLASYVQRHACAEAEGLLVAALLDDYLELLQRYAD